MYKYGGFWIRNVAAFIDMFPLIPLWFAISFVFSGNNFLTQVTVQIASAAYYILLNASAWQGTVGKKMLGLRIITLDGQRISLARSLARYAVLCVPGLPFVYWCITFDMAGFNALMASNPDPQMLANAPLFQSFMFGLTGSMGIMLILGIAWSIPVAVTREKKGIHDMMCKTRVVYAE